MQVLRRYFVAGLLVIIPVWGTYLVLEALLLTMDGVLGDFLKGRGVYYLPGFGIFILSLVIIGIGALATNFLGRRLLHFWEGLLSRVPLVRSVYALAKSVVDTFSIHSDDQRKFNRVVLIEYPRKGSYTIGFVTGEMKGDTHRISSEKVVNVFVPTVPNPISGFLLLVSESEVIPVSLSVEEAMKMAVSCGLYNPPLISEEAPLKSFSR